MLTAKMRYLPVSPGVCPGLRQTADTGIFEAARGVQQGKSSLYPTASSDVARDWSANYIISVAAG